MHKRAQTPQPASPVRSAVKKLINRLSREFANKPASPNITTDLPESASVNPTNLGTIDKLIQYLTQNKIKADGQQIAYSSAEYASIPEDARKNLAKFDAKLARDAATLKWNDDDFWVDVPALEKYISYLQQKADTMQNVQNNPEGKLLKVQVGKLVDELKNRINPNSVVARKPKGTPEKPAELPPDTPLDSFSDKKLLDPKSPGADTGAVQLFAKNLASRESLNDWLGGGGEWGNPATVVSYDPRGVQKALLYSDDNVDQCAMVHALYQRAVLRFNKARNEDEKRKYTFYVNKMRELGGTFTGPDGKACTIVGGPVAPVAAPGTQAGVVTDAVLQHMVQSLPLDPNDIDFHRIRSFFDFYKQILNTSQSPRRAEVENAMSQTEQYMDVVSRMTKGGDQTFNLSGDPTSFVNMLNGSPIGMYNSLLQNLQFIVERVTAVVGAFYAQYVRRNYGEDTKAIFNEDQRNAVEAQIIGSNSYAMRNKTRLQMLMQGGPKFVR